jgi:hypothetical protein
MNYILSEDLGIVSKSFKMNNIKKHNVTISNREKYLEKLNTLEFILQILNDKEYDNKFQFIELFIKKLFNIDNSKTPLNIKTIKEKVYDECFDKYLMDNNVNKLVNWMFCV